MTPNSRGFAHSLDDYAPDVLATLVKEGGRVASPTGAAGEGPGRTVMASPTPENLAPLAGLVADGKLRVPIQRTYELADAAEALTTLATTHTQGKLAICIQ
jgi:NADPH:quinone reductase